MQCEGDVCLPTSNPTEPEETESKELDLSSEKVQAITISIVSDTVWPWCFVGKRRLEAAVAKLDPKRVRVQVDWRPFQLDPTTPETSVNKLERYYKKFGKARTDSMIPHMKTTGKESGIEFSYGGKLGNTLKSHMLIEYAKQNGDNVDDHSRPIPLGATVSLFGLSAEKFNGLEGRVASRDADTGRFQVDSAKGQVSIKVKKQNIRVLSNQKVDDLIEVLFSYYFEQEKDIADTNVLAMCAEEAGLCSKEEMVQRLEAKASLPKVKSEIERAYSDGVSGVPFFFINGRKAFSGAQDEAQWLQQFRRLGVHG
jgi:predicted DsbA family dithiol-disulfide isomerase